MMSARFMLRADRVRRVPPRFSWLDQRLVREGRLRELSPAAGMLYLFLVTVSDRNGMSWYSPRRICLELGLHEQQLDAARAELERADLVAYGEPFWQVLSLGPRPAPAACPGANVGRVQGDERAATPAEVHAMVQEAFGPLGRDR